MVYKLPVRTSQETQYLPAKETSLLMLYKIWGFHGSDYEELRLLGYKTPVHTSQETRKIWGFHGGVYEECRLLGYKNLVHTSRETHYVSATEPSQLMLCKVWGFHGGYFEECCLLGYKNPIRTSQETHYASATEPSELMLCKFEIFTAVTMKNAVFRDVTSCGYCRNWRFGGT
jgi:hypothetical protein